MEAAPGARVRRRIRVRGIVQGVGFRPHVYGLAEELGLGGFVLNDAEGLVVEIEGAPDAVGTFERSLVERPPRLARIDDARGEDLDPLGEEEFRIASSESGPERRTLISADVSTCPDCLVEIRDPAARRYRYPFTNCTNCGPRFTITRDVPYDRPNTTMDAFPMCPACEAEYEDPSDRRFHAQPVACPDCGPGVRLADPEGRERPGDAIREAARLLAGGRILAVKGLGGYHLACDAADEGAVAALRSRKHREEKPFALMTPDLPGAGALGEMGETEARLLAGIRRPIVLLRRRERAPVAPSVAPGNRFLGVMLPYTPLHHLLIEEFAGAAGDGRRTLVTTSGNVSEEPIVHVDEEAYMRLAGVADAFLVHDRPIHIRCDDSVVRVHAGREYPVRRARGYAPEPLRLAHPVPASVLACGPELKHTFALAKGDLAFPSHHIGDLENWETLRSFMEGVEHFTRIFDVRPEVVAYDLHPDYLSTKWALEQVSGEANPLPGVELRGLPAIGVQHHHAHVASCLADNETSERVIGLALDGTGYGDDGTIWGCEVLACDLRSYERVGHLRSVPLPGGAAAIREPWRMGAVYLAEAFGEEAEALALPFVGRTRDRWGPILQMARRGVNAPPVSSAGRLFDAVAAICGVRDAVSYEGQAAIELEQAADPAVEMAYTCSLEEVDDRFVIDGVGLVRAVAEDLLRGADVPRAAAAFHNGMVRALVEACSAARSATGLETVALSGGTFQNVLLLDRLRRCLADEGFRVLVHHRVPPNDGGIALGQVMVAAARLGEV